VRLRVLGKDYEVRPTFAVLVRTEKRCGALMGLLSRLSRDGGISANEAAAVLHECVQSVDRKGPSFDAILAWATTGLVELSEACNGAAELLAAALPKPKEAEEGDASPPAAG